MIIKEIFTEKHIVSALKKQEAGIAVKEIRRELGIIEAIFYNWRAKYGGMEVYDVAKMKIMKSELSEYKKMVAELSLENRAMKNLIEKSCRAGCETGSC